MPFHILAHVNADHRLFITKDRFRKGFGQFRLSHSRGSEEEEGCDGTAAVAQPGARQTHGIGYGSYRLVLTDDPLMQTLFHLHQLVRSSVVSSATGTPVRRDTICATSSTPTWLALVLRVVFHSSRP